MAYPGTKFHLAPQQIDKAPNDRKSEPQAFGAIPFRIAQLIIFLEYPVLLIGRDAWSGVQNLNGNRRTSSPAADENASVVRIADGIRDEIAQDALQQDRIAIDDRGGWRPNQRQPLGSSFCLMIPAYPFKQSSHRKGLPVDLDGTGIELRDVEQR